MRILFISGREPTYVRNAMMLKCLKRSGVEIIDCTDSSVSYPARYVTVLTKYLSSRKNDVDLIYIGFFGQPLVPLIRMLTDKPILFDAFLSAYDTMCFDRKKFKPASLAGKFFYWLDKYSCDCSDRILLDTESYVDYFTGTFGLQKEKFQKIFVGADDSIFFPRDAQREDHRFRVFYYASYLPLHGTEYIVKAAGMLAPNREIEFQIVGKGPQHKAIRQLADSMGITNINFIDWIPYEELPQEIAKADICLGGHFSDIEKAKRVIAGKTYQFIAMKKPVIVGDCAGNRELFTDRENALMVKMADAEALANAIMELRDDVALRERIAEEGYRTFMQRCNIDAIRRELQQVIQAFE